MTTYDEIPYDSRPFTDTHPSNLAVLGRLFGLNTTDPENCRVLELGCASGGNLIPMAWYHPNSRFVGIELSDSQARVGTDLIDQLGLENVEIRQNDILDLGNDLGEFDYVLVHGVYSWVPTPVRTKILEICSTHLSRQGLAYISYNTLPGWRLKGMVRDMLLHHTRDATSPLMKVEKAKDFLTHLEPILEELNSNHTRYLRGEVRYLLASHASYLYHEFLEETNQAFLFAEFMEDARNHGLEYLCDVDLQAMFTSTLGDKAEAFLETFDDLIEQEQTIDFIRGRSFRQTLLCHDDQSLSREISLEDFENLAFFSDLSPPKVVEIKRQKPVSFTAPSGRRFPVSHPLTKAALIHLGRVFPDVVGFDDLCAAARRHLANVGGDQTIHQTDQLSSELFSLYAHQAIGAATRSRHFPHDIAARPEATALARAQAANAMGHLATAHHSTIELDAFSSRLVYSLDGSKTQEELAEDLTAEIVNGTLLLEPRLVSSNTPAEISGKVRANCDRLLSMFAANGILMSK